MKTLLLVLLLSLVGSANTQMKVESKTLLHTYSHKPSMKLKKQRELRALAKVTKDEAIQIASTLCHEDVTAQKLSNRGQLLYYRIFTTNCKVEVNALDGKIISKVVL
jgi:uncharacterized membrane protein YkoI